MPPVFPPDAAPDRPHLRKCQRVHLFGGPHARRVQPRLHARADAGKVGQSQPEQLVRQILGVQNDQAVRLLHLGSDFGEERVQPQPHRAVHVLAHLGLNPRLDVFPQPDRVA